MRQQSGGVPVGGSVGEAVGHASRARHVFWVLFALVLVVKLVVAAHLPLFVDEAFYWLEGQRLAAAYSDLPGLTAWLSRLGVELGGHHAFALRLPFLLIAAAVPWLVMRITAREFGAGYGWQAGSFALLLPLAGTLGLLALPDAPMALATLLCVDAGARLLRRVDAAVALELAAGLTIGALSHYRFIAVIGVGFLALLLLPDGRRALRDLRVWTAVAIGASAWAPLVAWNFDNADAGLRFQLVDRHPWAFHVDGAYFIAIQALLATPLLFAALMLAAWRGRRSASPVTRYLAILGGLVVLGFFVLGFFADTERVSFHWPLPAYLALLPLLPALLDGWPRWLRRLTWGTAAIGLVVALGYYVAVSIPEVRARTAAVKWHPSNFAGWETLAETVRGVHAQMPDGTRIVADNFKVGAELGFALGRSDIAVLDHPLNHRHGRAPQLQLWGLQVPAGGVVFDRPVLLVVGATDVKFSELLGRYQRLCSMLGPLPRPQVVNVDHGAQRFALFRLQPGRRSGPCVTPAIADILYPAAGEAVPAKFELGGWAIKDHAGVRAVTVMLDGRPVAEAEYGIHNDWVARFWGGRSRDPNHPYVAFSAQVDASGVEPGRHWLGLIVHGSDGSVEVSPEQPVRIAR